MAYHSEPRVPNNRHETDLRTRSLHARALSNAENAENGVREQFYSKYFSSREVRLLFR